MIELQRLRRFYWDGKRWHLKRPSRVRGEMWWCSRCGKWETAALPRFGRTWFGMRTESFAAAVRFSSTRKLTRATQ